MKKLETINPIAEVVIGAAIWAGGIVLGYIGGSHVGVGIARKFLGD